MDALITLLLHPLLCRKVFTMPVQGPTNSMCHCICFIVFRRLKSRQQIKQILQALNNCPFRTDRPLPAADCSRLLLLHNACQLGSGLHVPDGMGPFSFQYTAIYNQSASRNTSYFQPGLKLICVARIRQNLLIGFKDLALLLT